MECKEKAEKRKTIGLKIDTFRFDMTVPTVSSLATAAMATLSVAASS